eukprot:12920831-Prorocentrum_lima.AAC.1
MTSSLVGSEMCIRDRRRVVPLVGEIHVRHKGERVMVRKADACVQGKWLGGAGRECGSADSKRAMDSVRSKTTRCGCPNTEMPPVRTGSMHF